MRSVQLLLVVVVVVQADNDGELLAGEERIRRGAVVERDRRRGHQDVDLGTHVAASQLPLVLPEPHPRQRLLRDTRLRHRHGQQTSPARH